MLKKFEDEKTFAFFAMVAEVERNEALRSIKQK
jgi:hypothetical protein